MKCFRIGFIEYRAVNIDAETEEEAKQIVENKEWEYGMDFDNGGVEVISVDEL